jgi:hypothetical protein
VFWTKGVRPRTWLERTKAQQSMVLYIGLWAVLLALLIVAIIIRGSLL